MRRQLSQFRNAAVACQPCRVSHEFAESPMIGVLILDQARRQHYHRSNAAYDRRQLERMARADLQMGIAVEVDELQLRSQQGRRFFRLNGALSRSAESRRFAA